MASSKSASVQFDASLGRPTKRYGVYNQVDQNEGPQGIVYLPKEMVDALEGAKQITVTVTAK